MEPGSSAASPSGELDGLDPDQPDWRAKRIIQTTDYLDVQADVARAASTARREIADNRAGFHARRRSEARR
jgi:hypothetical protein